MSSSLMDIGVQIQRITLPIIIIVGIVGNSLNIAVLTRRTLYYHACSRYFLALASNNLLYTSIMLILRLFVNGYQIDPTTYSIILCKIMNYIIVTNAFLSPYFIVCASFDRYCASSTNALIRRFSSIRVAQLMIFIVVAVFLLFFIHILVLYDIYQGTTSTCAILADSVYSQVYLIAQVFLFAVVPPSLMILFGLMTIKNTTRLGVNPVVASRYNRTDRQLARMLFFQVTVHIFLTLPSSVTYLMAALPNTVRTTLIFSFLLVIFQMIFACSYASPFFLYLLSGRIYRKELIRLIHKLFGVYCRGQVEPLQEQTMDLPTLRAVDQKTRA
jgi:hypothetical protein